MAKRKSHIVLYMVNEGRVYIDSVIGQQYKAEERLSEIEKWKWVNQAWILPLDMNALDLEVPIRMKIKGEIEK